MSNISKLIPQHLIHLVPEPQIPQGWEVVKRGLLKSESQYKYYRQKSITNSITEDWEFVEVYGIIRNWDAEKFVCLIREKKPVQNHPLTSIFK